MNSDIKLKKFGMRTTLLNSHGFYKVISSNRDRLSPWFWWTDEKVTPNFTKAFIFMLLYAIDTKRKKIAHRLSKSKLYDEQFLIFNDKKVSGMLGLDDIDIKKQKAELWYFITSENEGKGIMSESLKKMEDYSFEQKNLNLLYAKTADGNDRSESILKRNNYTIEDIAYNVPTSRRNPKITNLTTWAKQLQK